MTSIQGQASAEYAGLLALAAVLGATLALIAGPTLVHGLRSALGAALSGSAQGSAPVVAHAADIADLQSALLSAESAVTPDAALVALARRHGETRAREIADALVLDAALVAAPWLGRRRTYRAWVHLGDGPYEPPRNDAGDRDVEAPTAAPAVAWITIAAQRRALAAHLAHPTSTEDIILDGLALVPGGGLLRAARAGAGELARDALRVPHAVDTAVAGTEVIDLLHSDPGDIPPGARAGDVVIEWPVHRTYWRDGRKDLSPLVDLGNGLGRHPPAHDYIHLVFLRPGPRGLRVIGEGFRA
jgi:hypothetical protein